LGFTNAPSGLICIIPNSNNNGEFTFPFITMNYQSKEVIKK
jgi:hypothetical protein